MFRIMRQIQMSLFRYRLFGKFVLVFASSAVLPILVNLMSTGMDIALQKRTTRRSRFIFLAPTIIALIIVIVLIKKVDYSRKMKSLPLVTRPPTSPQVSQIADPKITGSSKPQINGRPYRPLIDPRVREMVDCYVNERWGVQSPEYIMARIHTNHPVPDVEAALLSTLTLSGSKVLLRRLEIGPNAGNDELDELSGQITESLRRAWELDEDSTMQFGSFAVLKYTDEGLKWWRLQEHWTPTISSISRSSWTSYEIQAGRVTSWTVRGRNLQNATLKASAGDVNENLNIYDKGKLGEDVLSCEEPNLIRRLAPTFWNEVYIYALSSVEVEGVAFDLQSNPKRMSAAYWISVAQRSTVEALTIIIIVILGMIVERVAYSVVFGEPLS